MKNKLIGLSAALLGSALMLPSFAGEAPQLAAMVAAGDLPPLEERLPSNPYVLTPLESVGQYGGVWRSALKGTGDTGWIRRTVQYEPLMKYAYGWDGVEPNLAESVEVTGGGTVFTFQLREGHKWSDGTPFTAHDVVYTINMLQNPDYIGPSKTDHSKDAVNAVAASDTELVITLDTPNSLFLETLASVNGYAITTMQKAFCSQWDPAMDSGAEARIAEEGYGSWSEALEWHCGRGSNFDLNRPALTAWQYTTPYDGVAPVVVWERNPYYFKVDTAGNQLPYIDELRMGVVTDDETLVLKAVNGEIDFQNRHLATLQNKPLFFDNAEKNGYRLYETVAASMNTGIIMFNQTIKDPRLNKLFNDKQFRIAMSHAIDRQEIVDAVFVGQGEPFQAAPRPEAAFYNERLAKQYTEFDPDLADEILDAAGYDKRNDDGIRLDSNGDALSMRMDVTGFQKEFIDIAELLQGYWAEVGIRLDVRTMERTAVEEAVLQNTHEVHIWSGDGGLGDAFFDPRYYMPHNAESAQSIAWAYWFYDPTNTEAAEPPAAEKKQQELYNSILTATSSEERTALMTQILEIAADEFRTLGVTLPPPGYGVVNAKMRNVPENQPYAWIYPNPGPADLSQLYYVD